MDAGSVALLSVVGLAAGVVNTIAGGGTFVTLPALTFLGLPIGVANGTNRVSVLAQSLAAMETYRRDRFDGGDELLGQVLTTGIGSLLGAGLAVTLPATTLERAIAVCMLLVVGLALSRPSRWSEPAPRSPWRWPALLLVGAYGGFLQAGTGLLLLPCLVRLGGLDPVRANVRKALLVGTLTVPALLTFVASGAVWWAEGAVLAVGASVGAVLGARLTTRLGPRFVWAVLLLVVLASAARSLSRA